jgi:hypothetical protein
LTSNFKLNQTPLFVVLIHLFISLNLEELLHQALAKLILNFIALRLQIFQDIDTPELLEHHGVWFDGKYHVDNFEHISQYRLYLDAALQCFD